MSSIFVSYKREDELRVGRLVEALRAAGHDPWWDRSLPAGENWRGTIEAKLAAAGCVIVVWTRASTGPAGDFVRDEANFAKARGTLIPVTMERGVRPPLGFGELQAIDLSHWKGSPRDAFFRDLLAAIDARLRGEPSPAPRGPATRLAGRVAVGGFATAVTASLVSFGANLLGVQQALCGSTLGQPAVSDACGAFRLGGRPTREERLAFDALPAGDCDALQGFRARYESSPLRALADSRLNARQVTEERNWVATERRLVLYAGGSEAEARGRAAGRAAELCSGFASTGYFRLLRAEVKGNYSCDDGACGLEGEAICHLEELRVLRRERCGDGR